MSCNLGQYLLEQEISCRRIAQTCHDVDRREWLRNAVILLKRRIEHGSACIKCKSEVEK